MRVHCIEGGTLIHGPAETARRADTTGGISVEALMTELGPQAQGACVRSLLGSYTNTIMLYVFEIDEVPSAVRQDVIGVLRKLLERQIEF